MNKSLDKNRLQRLKILDSILSESGGGYSISQLVRIMTTRLGYDVNRYVVKRDLSFIRDTLGINVVGTRKNIELPSNNSIRKAEFWHYKNKESAIFTVSESLTDEEREYLAHALEMLGIKGFSNSKIFKKLNLKVPINKEIISFTKNPSEPSISNVFDKLIQHIKSKDVISIKLRDRIANSFTRHHVHPWYLREYNRRWYLFGYDDKDKKIEHYCLDRLSTSISVLSKSYIGPNLTMDEILKDVIGVSIPNGDTLEIIFWVSEISADFVKNKPLHKTQEQIDRTNILSSGIPLSRYDGGLFFRIYCKKNYELIRELMSFGPELIVLTPNEIRSEIKQRTAAMYINYDL